MCDEGDEVLIPAPYWVSYPEMVNLAGGRPVILSTTIDKGFKVTAEDIERHVTPKTSLLILNTPSNPTGAIYTKEELEAIAEVCVKHNIAVISDEIYEKLVYEGEHVSFASIGPEVKDITITAVSYTHLDVYKRQA